MSHEGPQPQTIPTPATPSPTDRRRRPTYVHRPPATAKRARRDAERVRQARLAAGPAPPTPPASTSATPATGSASSHARRLRHRPRVPRPHPRTAPTRRLAAHCGVTTVALEATGVYGHVLFLTLLRGRLHTRHDRRRSSPARSRAGPRPTDATASGFNACTSTACCRPSSNPTTPPTPCATTSANAPTWCVSPASTSNACKKPWS